MRWFARSRHTLKNNPWRVHGYFFSLCYALFGIPLMRWSVAWMDIPPDVSVRDYLSPAMGGVFLVSITAAGMVGYLLAILASLGKIALVDAFRRRIERARDTP